jgi:ATP-dependent protease HslVU (ClpYQ) peptidase subunit
VTCIVGVQTSDGVLIGGDSAGISGWVRTHRADPKVFEHGTGYVIGFTTSFRMGQLIRYADLPKPLDRDGDDLDRFMAVDFVDAVRQALKDGGWAEKDKDREDGGTFLVGVNGWLYKVCDDYQVGRSLDGYDAAGSGWELALGALHATPELEPVERVTRALSASAHHSASVHPPFTVVIGGRPIPNEPAND